MHARRFDIYAQKRADLVLSGGTRAHSRLLRYLHFKGFAQCTNGEWGYNMKK
jgi:hypothetical protein